MKVVKYDHEFGLIVSFQELDKQFDVLFAGNCDLYWIIRSKIGNNNHNFIITKENYDVEELFDDIDNVKIFDEHDYFGNRKKEIEYEKNKYILFNHSNYNELFDKENNIITWYSDETNHKVANILKIKKEKELFKLEFYIQPYVNGYDRDFNSLNYISIRFRNSGSSYNPFNIIFMRMYQKMKQIDDVNDYGHQIHIEEYLYYLNNIKKLTK